MWFIIFNRTVGNIITVTSSVITINTAAADDDGTVLPRVPRRRGVRTGARGVQARTRTVSVPGRTCAKGDAY